MDYEQFYWSAVMEEYKTLRDESKQASINMYSAMQWGAAFVGVAVSAGFSQWDKHTEVPAVVFLVFVPLLSVMAMFLWLGEALRFKRVGDYLVIVEQKVAFIFRTSGKLIKPCDDIWSYVQENLENNLDLRSSPLTLNDPLCWEQWLKYTRRDRGGSFFVDVSGHQTLMYLFRLTFFPLIMILSYLVGIYYLECLNHGSSLDALVKVAFLSVNGVDWLKGIGGLIGSLGTRVAEKSPI